MGPGWDRVIDALMEELAAARDQTWVVGGRLRDALFALPEGDLDLVTAADPLAVAQGLRARLGASVARLPRSVRVGVPPSDDDDEPRQIDITALLTPIEDDLRQRDFTVDAMALPLPAWAALRPATDRQGAPVAPADLLDPTGGFADLMNRLLRTASPTALRDEPGRVIRGARLIARHALTPTDETIALATDASPLMRDLSTDRLHDELNALLAAPGCAEGMAFLERVGAFALLFPELSAPRATAHALGSLRWTARIQRPADPEGESDGFNRETPIGRWYAAPLSHGAPRVTALRWGLLLHALTAHDEGGLPGPRGEQMMTVIPGTRRLLHAPERRIAYEIEARASFTARLIGMREPDERDLRRLFAVAGEVTVDVLVAAAACVSAQRAEGIMRDDEARLVVERVRAILALYFADPARLIPQPLLTGRDLIQALGVTPGPEIHRLLSRVREAQLDGDVTTRAEALALAADLPTE